MNLKKTIFIAFLSLSLFTTRETRAAFPVKQETVQTSDPAQTAAGDELSTNEHELTAVSEVKTTTETTVKKKSFVSRLFHNVAEKAAAVPQALYIVLAIFSLGWLAMGINDNFEGANWLISLLLYILFYFPGLIYTLIKMGDYY